MAGYIKRNDRVDVVFEMDEHNKDIQMRIKTMKLREYASLRKRTTMEQEERSNKRKKLEKNLNYI